MTKKYAVVIDVSPSEQLGDNPDELKSMALLFALRDPESFDRLGSNSDDENNRLPLKKWSGSSQTYKNSFIDHAIKVLEGGAILCGINQASDRVIKKAGAIIFEELYGPFPAPSSQNRKGKDRLALGGYKVDGKTIPKFEVLKDDLYILGWITEALASYLKMLDEINGRPVKLDVLSDRLPNEQGDDEYYKATLLKQMVEKATDDRASIVGVADPDMETQRELFVDDLAGLASEIENKPNGKTSKYLESKGHKIFSFERKNT